MTDDLASGNLAFEYRPRRLFRLGRPGNLHGFGYGFLFRLIAAVLAGLVGVIAMVVGGAFTQWTVTPGLIAVSSTVVAILIFLGEHFRSRVYERVVEMTAKTDEVDVTREDLLSFSKLNVRPPKRVSEFTRYEGSEFQDDTAARRPRGPTRNQLILKRALDIFLASVAIILAAPAMLVLAALIRFDSPGPAVVRFKRVGFDGKLFYLHKFRTVTVGEYDLTGSDAPALRRDPRITNVGRFLRPSSLDELPQLFNVLSGAMSLVGPRPRTREEIDALTKAYGYFVDRQVKPGMTSMSALRATPDLPSMIADDLYYAKNWSFSMDLYILFRTLMFFIFPFHSTK